MFTNPIELFFASKNGRAMFIEMWEYQFIQIFIFLSPIKDFSDSLKWFWSV